MKKHFKINENGVKYIHNLTGVGPTDLDEIVINFDRRDLYVSRDASELTSKWGYLYVSGYQHPSIINDFYKIMFESKELANKVIEEYTNEK